ncbi:unnamed protein product [Lepeophtheirus salmonis]|uniref:(salmon louse) hypothetical protein n=1 Tax=Lepeophtheirus salmonis TaxID=72036 RepID=A0A7R8CNJ8_LEPSM|nr:unnamed protein product [Lepeophtheirus salmonis]CAF2846654.1 unnamed protein product [Lepeophtheirus salmonis]
MIGKILVASFFVPISSAQDITLNAPSLAVNSCATPRCGGGIFVGFGSNNNNGFGNNNGLGNDNNGSGNNHKGFGNNNKGFGNSNNGFGNNNNGFGNSNIGFGNNNRRLRKPSRGGIGGTHYKEYTCGSTVDDKIFFFVNPLYPDSLPNETLDCHLVISHDCSESTCQIRLDFEEFEISPPVHGDCSKDRFEIDSESPTPILCAFKGYNSKHHLYADVQSRKKTQLRFIIKPLASPKLVIESNGVKSFKSEENSNKSFKILVTQISCGCAKTFNETSSLIKFNNPHLAPIGCTQYFKNLHTGYIKTFNYGGTIRNYEPCFNSSDPICGERVPTGYLNNLDYSICIELPKDHCGLTFTSSSFDVGILPTGRRSIIEKQCEKDYIYIPQGMHPEVNNYHNIVF